jgi:hypothetical protein
VPGAVSRGRGRKNRKNPRRGRARQPAAGRSCFSPRWGLNRARLPAPFSRLGRPPRRSEAPGRRQGGGRPGQGLCAAKGRGAVCGVSGPLCPCRRGGGPGAGTEAGRGGRGAVCGVRGEWRPGGKGPRGVRGRGRVPGGRQGGRLCGRFFLYICLADFACRSNPRF